MSPDYLEIFRAIQSTPTAPFHEYHVRDLILSLLKDCPRVRVEHDAFGNLIATYQRGNDPARFAFAAHMDHPGFVRSPHSGGWKFLGGVPSDILEKEAPRREFGDFAMWDLPEFTLRDGCVHARVCDDLVGCAAIVCLFLELEKREVEATCHGLFTRAEEVGFVGAIHLAKHWPFGKEVRFISLETSAAVPGLELGGGPVIRVGDRMSVFDHIVTGDLVQVAAQAEIQVQRGLLDKGSCEATAMQHYGIPSAGISILLGNYHNCTPERTIDAEYVNLEDADAMVQLITELVIRAGTQSPGLRALGEKFDQRVADHEQYAESSRERYFSPIPASASKAQDT